MYMSKRERNRVSVNGQETNEIVEWEGMEARCLAYKMFIQQDFMTIRSSIPKQQPSEAGWKINSEGNFIG